MKCKNCGNEQDNGKFCGKCGMPLEQVESTAIVESTTEVPTVIESVEVTETGSTTIESTPVVSAEPLIPVSKVIPEATTAQPQANEQVERVKDTSKKYIEYIKEFAANPSRIFKTEENQFTNALITIAIILLLASYTIFAALQAFYKSPLGLGLVSMYEENPVAAIFGNQAFKLSLFPTYGNAFIAFLIIIALSAAISLGVMKFSKQSLSFTQFISIYGAFLIPVIGVIILSLLFILLNKIVIGLFILIIGFALAIYLYPLRIIFYKFSEESKVDATHRGLIYFVSISIILYIIGAQYTKEKLGSLISMFDQLKYFMN